MGNETEFSLLWTKNKLPAETAIEKLSQEYCNIIFGLHTAHKAELWLNGNQLAKESSYKVNVLKTTGAGDNWHAGLLTGWILGLSYSEMTLFANAVAGYQISTGDIGNLKEIESFMANGIQYAT